jgi:hypothetical protein
VFFSSRHFVIPPSVLTHSSVLELHLMYKWLLFTHDLSQYWMSLWKMTWEFYARNRNGENSEKQDVVGWQWLRQKSPCLLALEYFHLFSQTFFSFSCTFHLMFLVRKP